MPSTNSIQATVTKKLQECLKELGFDAELSLSDHEGIVHARKDIEGKCVRIVAHITDREVKTAVGGGVSYEIARARLATAVIRPTLAAQAATRFVPETVSNPCLPNGATSPS
ncbi:MAG: hypothetical protein ALAOOOJD_01762 [bacterium]|nr:hypothetical protein [bacterium]